MKFKKKTNYKRDDSLFANDLEPVLISLHLYMSVLFHYEHQSFLTTALVHM